jgi:hypothetical protein
VGAMQLAGLCPAHKDLGDIGRDRGIVTWPASAFEFMFRTLTPPLPAAPIAGCKIGYAHECRQAQVLRGGMALSS